MSDAVSDRIVVRADPAAVMAVITDFAAYPQWQDEVTAAQVLEHDAQGRATRVRLALDARVLRGAMVLAYDYPDPATLRWRLVESDLLRRNDGSYALADRGDGTTEVTYTLEVDPTVRLPGLLRRQAARRIADGALKGMKARVEAG
jgi:ribosome-associated toxin RatA of RatAB toxin-antitoxin module